MTKKKKISLIVIIFLVLIVGAVFMISSGNNKTEYITAKIEKGIIKQTVSETGTVKSGTGVDLSFSNAGKLNLLPSEVGQKIKEEDVLAELDYSDLIIRKNEVQANLDVAKTTLAKTLIGATSQDILVSKASVDQANKSFESSKKEFEKIKNLIDEQIKQAESALNDLVLKTDADITPAEQSVTTAETGLENTRALYQARIDNLVESSVTICDEKLTSANNILDIIDQTLTDGDGEDLISKKDLSYLTKANLDYTQAETLLDNTRAQLLLINGKASENVQALLSDTYLTLSKTFECLQNTYLALENSITSSSFSLSELEALKTTISAQQTLAGISVTTVQTTKQNFDLAVLNYDNNVSVARDNLLNAKAVLSDAVTRAKNALSSARISGDQQITQSQSRVDNSFQAWQLAQAQFSKITAPANYHDINLAKAHVRQAEASLESVNKTMDNSVIKAPFSGIITKINYDLDEQVPPGQTVISLISQQKYEIEVMISEVDISKVIKGDKVVITLDSFGEDVRFYGDVDFIDPAETAIDGVIYYKTVINFNNDNFDIKPGMTANIDITTSELADVLILPIRAIVDNGVDGKFARILKDGIVVNKKVELGLYGNGGVVEVLSGLSEGEEVVTYIKK